jgi:hypothetical protein
MIDQYHFYHGAALREICAASKKAVSIEILDKKLRNDDHNYNIYIINNQIPVYIKHSTSRSKRWRFSFITEHQDTVRDLYEMYGNLVMLLICHNDGIVGLNFDELKEILDDNHEEIEWIGVKRRKRELYAVSGSDGKLKHKIAHHDFIKKILGTDASIK